MVMRCASQRGEPAARVVELPNQAAPGAAIGASLFVENAARLAQHAIKRHYPHMRLAVPMNCAQLSTAEAWGPPGKREPRKQHDEARS